MSRVEPTQQFKQPEQLVRQTPGAQCDGVRQQVSDVLIVIHKLGVGGTELHLLNVLTRLVESELRIRVYVLHPGGKLESAFERRGIHVVRPSQWGRCLGIVGSALALLREIVRSRARIVHFFLPEAYIVGGLVSRLAPRRVFIMSRRSLNRYQAARWLVTVPETWLHQRMDMVLGNSNAVLAELRTEGVPASRLRLIYNGIEPRDYKELPSRHVQRETLGIECHELVLITVANLIPYKGHADLLEALGVIRDDLPTHWTLLLVGRDDGIGFQLRRQSKRLGIESHIRWLGERSDVVQFLGAADIAILPSHQEGFSNSLVESMAAGLPCIATAVGGNCESVVDGVTGLLVPVQDVDGLSHAIQQLALNPDIRSEMGAAARRRVCSQFTMERTVEGYRATYEQLLGSTDRTQTGVD